MKQHLTQLQLDRFTAEREWTVDEIPVLSAVISLPQPTDTANRTARRIHRYYQLQGRSFFSYCENWLLPQAEEEYRLALESSRPLPHFHAELTYQVTLNQDGFLSLYTQSREPSPGKRDLLQRRGDTWDLTAGYPVPLKDFFPRGSRWKRTLLSAAEAEILRQEAAGVSSYHDSWKQKLRRHFNPHNYYFTETGLCWFYPMYAIGPAAEGIPVFSLPYSSLPLRHLAQTKTPAP